MSRIAKKPVPVPSDVNVSVNGQVVNVKGAKGNFEYTVHDLVSVSMDDNQISFAAKSDSHKKSWAMAGTMRSLVDNMVTGVNQGFTKKLELVGVGYRAKAAGQTLNLTLGFSHPVNYAVPEGITVETPKQTEIIVSGVDKQLVGQVAANIRAYRPPEPYKGKGVKYANERIIRKETKKK